MKITYYMFLIVVGMSKFSYGGFGQGDHRIVYTPGYHSSVKEAIESIEFLWHKMVSQGVMLQQRNDDFIARCPRAVAPAQDEKEKVNLPKYDQILQELEDLELQMDNLYNKITVYNKILEDDEYTKTTGQIRRSISLSELMENEKVDPKYYAGREPITLPLDWEVINFPTNQQNLGENQSRYYPFESEKQVWIDYLVNGYRVMSDFDGCETKEICRYGTNQLTAIKVSVSPRANGESKSVTYDERRLWRWSDLQNEELNVNQCYIVFNGDYFLVRKYVDNQKGSVPCSEKNTPPKPLFCSGKVFRTGRFPISLPLDWEIAKFDSGEKDSSSASSNSVYLFADQNISIESLAEDYILKAKFDCETNSKALKFSKKQLAAAKISLKYEDNIPVDVEVKQEKSWSWSKLEENELSVNDCYVVFNGSYILIKRGK